jgi:hypothetical protein
MKVEDATKQLLEGLDEDLRGEFQAIIMSYHRDELHRMLARWP